MIPCFPTDDPLHLALTGAEFMRNKTLATLSSGVRQANHVYDFICELGVSIPLPLLLSSISSSFFVSVGIVDRLRAFKQMLRIDTWRIIASVTSAWFGPISVGEKERDSVCLVFSSVGFEAPIFLGSSIPSDPGPTSIWASRRINLGPKPGCDRIGEHLALLTLNVALPAITSGAGASHYNRSHN